MPYFLLFINILLMSAGQLFFKESALFINKNSELSFIQGYINNPYFYAAVSFFAISTFVWVKILTQMKISVAYPLLSLSYILTAIGAYYIFQEKITSLNLVGVFLIMSGVALISIK